MKTKEQLIDEFLELLRQRMPEPETDTKIGETLIQMGYLTESQLERYLKLQKRLDMRGKHMLLGEIILQSGIIKEENMRIALTERLRKQKSIQPTIAQQRGALLHSMQNDDVTFRYLQLCVYLHTRWLFYEARDGEYISEQHDHIVLSEASQEFGITQDEVLQIFYRIERIRLLGQGEQG